jgi:hypothetical protein
LILNKRNYDLRLERRRVLCGVALIVAAIGLFFIMVGFSIIACYGK